MTSARAAYTVDRLGRFVADAGSSDLSDHALAMLKRNVLDSIACALGALDGELIPAIRAHAEQFSGRPTATFVGGGRASVDQAAFFNAVLVRYPDLLDTYLTPGGLCHPGGQLRRGARRRRTRRGQRRGFPAGACGRLRDPMPVQRTGSRHGPRPQSRAATGDVGGRRLGQAARSRRRHHRRCDRRVRGRQRVACRGAHRARVELEGHLAGHHRHARGVRDHARRPRNHRPRGAFRGPQRPGAAVRPADRPAHIRPVD